MLNKPESEKTEADKLSDKFWKEVKIYEIVGDDKLNQKLNKKKQFRVSRGVPKRKPRQRRGVGR
jgi:hypothetical protein